MRTLNTGLPGNTAELRATSRGLKPLGRGVFNVGGTEPVEQRRRGRGSSGTTMLTVTSAVLVTVFAFFLTAK